MVVAGVGVDHDKFVDCVDKFFVQQKPIWEMDRHLFSAPKHLSVDESLAQYTGGLVQVFITNDLLMQCTQDYQVIL